MNFLDAHKIFYEYSAVLGNGTFAKKDLPCNGDLEIINNAAIIIISHFYFYHLGNQEDFDRLFMVASFLGDFKDEDTLRQEKELERYIEKNSKFPWTKINKKGLDNAKIELAELIAKSSDSSLNFALLERREKITNMFFDKYREEQWNRNSIDDTIKAAQYLYDILGVEYTDLDICSFFTIQMMKDLKKDFDEGGFLYYNVELNKQLVQHITRNWNYISNYNY